jgi:hypothetical protein
MKKPTVKIVCYKYSEYTELDPLDRYDITLKFYTKDGGWQPGNYTRHYVDPRAAHDNIEFLQEFYAQLGIITKIEYIEMTYEQTA